MILEEVKHKYNEQSYTTHKGWSFGLGVGASTSAPDKISIFMKISLTVAYRGCVCLFTPPPPPTAKFQSFDKAKLNSQFH
jgi:hypothetical protein